MALWLYNKKNYNVENPSTNVFTSYDPQALMRSCLPQGNLSLDKELEIYGELKYWDMNAIYWSLPLYLYHWIKTWESG